MQQNNSSQQFSFWSHQASQGSNRPTYSKDKRLKQQQKTGQAGKSSQYADTKTSSKNERKRIAGMKSRQKKKSYIKCLEQNVNRLDIEIEEIDIEISRCKDNLADAIRTSNHNSNEHAFTFAQLERNALSEDPDLDRINLLIDLIRNRIGANGKQRQAKLDYNFKQIVNSIFPAIHRYLLNSAHASLDIFSPEATPNSLVSNLENWTYQFYSKINPNYQQISKISSSKQQLCGHRNQALEMAARLKAANQKIKKQGQIFEKHLGYYFRGEMTPIQCAHLTLFAEKNKLRREFGFEEDFEEDQQSHKKIKTQ